MPRGTIHGWREKKPVNQWQDKSAIKWGGDEAFGIDLKTDRKEEKK